MANKIDPKFNQKVMAWLRSKHDSEENIIKGATLLLQLNRNRGLFERLTRQPKRHVDKIVYELKKHLNYRLQSYSIEDIIELDKEVEQSLPKMESIDADVQTLREVDTPPISPEYALPVAEDGATIIRGRRPDHDKLPEEIQKLFTENGERWNKIKEKFELLKTLNEPCDRFEHLKMLKEAWYTYKKNMCRYDDYKLSAAEIATLQKVDQNNGVDQKDIDAAQSYISRNLGPLLDLAKLAKEPDFPEESKAKLEDLREKVQVRVNLLLKGGVILSDQRKADFNICGIRFTPDAEGEKSE